MDSKDLLKKQELAEELGMKFDEASVLFSEETLETMRMMNVVGGSDDGANNCHGGYCVEGCGGTHNGCKTKEGCNVFIGCGNDTEVHGKKCGTTTPDPTTPDPTIPTTPDPTTPPGPGTTTPAPTTPTTPIGPGENLPDPTRP